LRYIAEQNSVLFLIAINYNTTAMKIYRSILALVLVVVTTFLVSCGGPKAALPTYTPDKLAKIEQLTISVTALRDKMPFLEEKIQNRNWTDVGTYIHGPLGNCDGTLATSHGNYYPQTKKRQMQPQKTYLPA
jgi:photosystem II protein PsbQ